MNALLDGGRRVLGLVLLVLVVVPVFRILDGSQVQSPEELMRRSGGQYWDYTWGVTFGSASLLVLGLAIGLALLARGKVGDALEASGAWLARPPRWVVAVALGVIGAGLTAWVAQNVFDGRAILNDASVQLLQARYFAAGYLAAPPLAMPEFWSIQFMVHTAAGWVAQYPPSHALWLALGFKLGAPWISMALAMGVMGLCLGLSLERLVPERVGAMRLAALFAVCSPMLLALAGSYMNHVTIAAFASVALYCALRADEGAAAWAIGAGAAMGMMVSTRPVSGLAIGAVVTAALWCTGARHAEGFDRPWLQKRIGLWVLGGLPFALGLAWFNTRFFGNPWTLGYTAASGPNHGLGFHENPWGQMYAPTQAIGFTSSELLALGRELLGTPLPIVAFVGAFLLVAPKLSRGERILVGWATLPVLASALYWHHDLLFGPRMLGGAAAAWCGLFVLSVAGLMRRLGRGWQSDAIALVVVAAIGFAAAIGAPERVTRLGARIPTVPAIDGQDPALVFVHEPWQDRLGARLSARGMRLDSVRNLLMRFNPCVLEASFAGRPVQEVEPRCILERQADSLTWLGLTDFVWLGDLPGIEAGDGILWARDLGPEANARLIAAHPNRRPRFLVPVTRGAQWNEVSYEQGLRKLWGGVLAADSIAAANAAPSTEDEEDAP